MSFCTKRPMPSRYAAWAATSPALGSGYPLPPMLRVPPRGKRTWELTLSPWLLGAYIWPDKRSETLVAGASYTNRAWFAGTGVVVNLITGLAVWGALDLWRGNYRWAATWIGLAAGAWFLRKAVTFVLPAFGVAALILVINGMFARPSLPQGPVGAAVVISEATTATHAFTLIGALAIAMAVVNCVPIYPFDGGRVADAALRRLFGDKTANVFTLTTTFCALGFLVYAVATDIWYLIT
jgi:Zn-dependent protease